MDSPSDQPEPKRAIEQERNDHPTRHADCDPETAHWARSMRLGEFTLTPEGELIEAGYGHGV